MYSKTPLFKAVTVNLPHGMAVEEAVGSIATDLHFDHYDVVSFSIYTDPMRPAVLKVTVLGKVDL